VHENIYEFTGIGTFQTRRDVRLESAVRAKADVTVDLRMDVTRDFGFIAVLNGTREREIVAVSSSID
jgi:hypothetical protein